MRFSAVFVLCQLNECVGFHRARSMGLRGGNIQVEASPGDNPSYYRAQWDLLEKYQAGDWRGYWTTVDGAEIKVRTHLEVNAEKDAIKHANTYHKEEGEDVTQHGAARRTRWVDSRPLKRPLEEVPAHLKVTKAYGEYRRGDPLRSKNLRHSFLFGPGPLPPAMATKAGEFAAEVGLRCGDARVRVVAVHAPEDGTATLQKVVVIREVDGDAEAYGKGRLDLWAPPEAAPLVWHGTAQTWVAESDPAELEVTIASTAVSPRDNHVILSLAGGIRVLVPQVWAVGETSNFIVEWTPANKKRRLTAQVEATLTAGDDDGPPKPKLEIYFVSDLVPKSRPEPY